jgi:hypothetical protein
MDTYTIPAKESFSFTAHGAIEMHPSLTMEAGKLEAAVLNLG